MRLSDSDRRRIHTVSARILTWYGIHGRDFPWRSAGANGYLQIVSEVLLQRTRADSVSSFLPIFLKSYPTWTSLSEAEPDTLAQMIKPIGLQIRRSKSLILLAKTVVDSGGDFPDSREEILSMPGVGQYIANAVELFRFSRPRPLLDTNMVRVIERYFRKRKLADIRYDPWLQTLAQRAVETGAAKEINWGFLDLGALVCKPAKPECPKCPLRKGCRFRSENNW